MELLGFDLPLWQILLPSAFYLFYRFCTRTSPVFEKMGVPTAPSPSTILGMYHLFKAGWLGGLDQFLTKTYGKVFGAVINSEPHLHVADVDLLKDIQIKHFKNFRNHVDYGVLDGPLVKMPYALNNDEWKDVRSMVTPAFSVAKLKGMTANMNKSCKTLVEILSKKADLGKPLDFKETMETFGMDAMAWSVFGMDLKCQTENQTLFLSQAKRAFNFSMTSPRMLVLMLCPSLFPVLKKLGISFFPKDAEHFFAKILAESVKGISTKEGDSRANLFQLMVNARKDQMNGDGTQTPLIKESSSAADANMLGMATTLFMAGYSTMADALTFTLYALAMHPDIQAKVSADISEAMATEDEVSYDVLHKMKYLDMVVHESLRLYPKSPRADRVCSKDTYVKGIHIPKGMPICILTQALHMDPEVWPEPEKIDPERFTPERKAERDPLYWQPFGAGPRQCVGMRLALMQIKMALVHVLQNFVVKTCNKTSIPIKRDPLLGMAKECFLKVERRV